jgi:hypothetical protein
LGPVADKQDEPCKMNLRTMNCLFLFCLATGFAAEETSPSPGAGSATGGGGEQTSSAVPPAPQSSQPPQRTPSWMKWGVELRGRLELPAAVNFEADQNDRFYLNRIRVWAGIEATRRLRFHVEGQDARGPGFSDSEALDSVEHHLDIRQAYAEFGGPKGAWEVRAGRQELAFGDERLVGADNYWDALGQTFDALRLSYRRPGLRLDGFGAFVVAPTCERLTRPSTGNRLYGLYASLDKGIRGSVIDPYVFWKSNRRVGDGVGPRGDSDVFTYGARAAGHLPPQLDYNVEMALQGGHEAEESIRAWAGHWELGFRPLRADFGPRLGAEYNFASGDSHPADGRHTTFDDLYPSGYNKYGMADPFAWRNLRNIAGGLDCSLNRSWRLGLGYRALWLASIQDSLYTEGDSFLTHNPQASGDHVGNQASIMATWEPSERWQFHAGLARFFPGSYLTDSSYPGRLSTPFFMVNYRFAP